MNIIEKLKQFNVEVTPEMEKTFSGDFLSELEVNKKLSKAENDRDSWKQRAETAEETLKGFEGKDFDTITKERDEWKKKAEDAEKEYSAKEAKREFDDILKEAIAEVKGKNEKAILANLDVEALMKSRNQREDIKKALEALKTSEDTSFMFVDEKQESLEQNKAKIFTGPMKNQNGNNNGNLTKKDIMAIKDPVERQQKIAENMSLFQK